MRDKVDRFKSISGPFFRSGKVKNLKISDIGAGATMGDFRLHVMKYNGTLRYKIEVYLAVMICLECHHHC